MMHAISLLGAPKQTKTTIYCSLLVSFFLRGPIHIHLTTQNFNLTLWVGGWIKFELPWRYGWSNYMFTFFKQKTTIRKIPPSSEYLVQPPSAKDLVLLIFSHISGCYSWISTMLAHNPKSSTFHTCLRWIWMGPLNNGSVGRSKNFF